ncbi:MAG: PBP1A family penicillin-binding protein [Magnetospirillum sp. WYHS-4]
MTHKRPLRAESRPHKASAPEPKPPGRKRAVRTSRLAGDWLRRLFQWAAVAAVWAAIAVGILVAWFATDLPDVEQAVAASRRPTVALIAADGSEILTVGDLYGAPLRLSEMSPSLPAAVLATEDRRFQSHFGLDPIGLARAAVSNLRAGRVVQGGSTISQQVAKNLFLSPEKTLKRKVQELLLAIWLERKFTKDQILTLYLNRVYLGAGTYGVEAAAQRYFGRSARQLGLYESALIAGLLKAPSRYNPQANPEASHQRTLQVLANMVAAEVISGSQAAEAGKSRAVAQAAARATGRVGRHFADWVLEQVADYIAQGDEDLKVFTTLNPRMQIHAERAVDAVLDEVGERDRISQAALVAVAPDGAVRAMVGGRELQQSGFNRATQAQRQPGSSFKPFVYLTALEQGYTPETRVTDRPVSIKGWSPANFDGKFRGEIALREAVAESVNTVAVQVSEAVGSKRVAETAQRLGVTSPLLAAPALALGASEVNLLELTSAYGAFGNGGRGIWPYAIVEIRNARDRVLYRRSGGGPGQVIRPEAVAALNELLSGVIAQGTGKRASLGARPAAGKTGTSSDFRDAWFVGYTADLTAGVWVGNDDGGAMRGVTGGSAPARIWKSFMAGAHEGLAVRGLPGGTSNTPPSAAWTPPATAPQHPSSGRPPGME